MQPVSRQRTGRKLFCRLLQRIATLFLATASLQHTIFAEDVAGNLRRPNIVLIVADDLGWADLGCYGSTFHRTPHLDALAASGIRFTDAYSACPVCSPTRAALMTGKVPARLNLTDWLPGRGDRPDQKLNRPQIRQELPLEETTLAEVLRSAGYATAHIGKWHLGGEGYGPREQGFDLNIAGDHTGTPRSYFSPFQSNKSGQPSQFMPGLESAKPGEYLTDRLTEEAIRFIAANKEKPFFIYLPHYAVHTPLKAPDDAVAKYKSWDGVAHGRQENPIYAAMLERVDAGVGRIVAELERLQLSEQTLIVFTSDNGGLATTEGPNTPATYNGPLREGKGYLYEGGIRVPLVISGFGTMKSKEAKPRTSDVPVWSCDILPTVLELSKLPAMPVDGVSIASLLKDDLTDEKAPARAREALYWHYPHYANQGGRPGGAIRAGQWKLIEFYENGRRELYDLKAGLGESRNLAAEKPEIVERLAKQLDAWRRAVDARMPTPNPGYVPNPQAADGSILLPARYAEVHGVQLRYEPLPHKNTLGFWIDPTDYATWEFTVSTPGRFEVEVSQGCGTGNGGSVVDVIVGEQTLTMTVEDTGHFQNFKPRVIGNLELTKPGRYVLAIKPKTKAKAAVMDVRQIVLRPVPDAR
ncbi:MAG: sulfatase-like hydrolase/transferase [Planctomycetia bacterium]|nr:sulfatase-like hydrolase/transferase [Planctomycetia bacterium]